MTPEHRKKYIYEELLQNGAVTIRIISTQLGVTRETIRKDITELVETGLVRQVRGGAMLETTNEAPLAMRTESNLSGKTAIAIAAADLVNDGDTIILDSGSSTRVLAKQLRKKHDLQIITNDLQIGIELRRCFSSVIMLGGNLSPDENIASGYDAIEMLARYTADFAFIGIGGLTEEKMFTDYTRGGVALRAAMISSATHPIALVDKNKVGRPTAVRMHEASDLRTIITDAFLTAPLKQSLIGMNIKIIQVEGA